MFVYKVDTELNRVSDIKNADNLVISCDYDLGTSDKLTVFSSYKESTLWVDQRLIHEGTPLVRINKTITKYGVEFLILPLADKLIGSVYLFDAKGIAQYNLIFKSNER